MYRVIILKHHKHPYIVFIIDKPIIGVFVTMCFLYLSLLSFSLGVCICDSIVSINVTCNNNVHHCPWIVSHANLVSCPMIMCLYCGQTLLPSTSLPIQRSLQSSVSLLLLSYSTHCCVYSQLWYTDCPRVLYQYPSSPSQHYSLPCLVSPRSPSHKPIVSQSHSFALSCSHCPYSHP